MQKVATNTAGLALTGDLRFQLDHVARASRRLMALQDQDPNSPSFGCFHTAYWRDKTSEFTDARFQEAGAALGLLSLPVFDALRAAEMLPSGEELFEAFLAGAANLARQQYVEGSYDEWYKGERGFAATAFTTVAYGFAALHLGKRIPREAYVKLLKTLTRAADWLSCREDIVKINHEIVAAVSLATVWKLTGELRYRESSRRKFEISLKHRNREGWFNELAGCDLGYSHLVLDQLALYYWLTADPDVPPVASELIAFLVPHLHPDLTAASEAGTCRNPYVGQIAFVMHEAHNPTAAVIDLAMRSVSGNWRRIAPYLADDLRLARWAILPILAFLLAKDAPTHVGAAPLAEIYPQGWTVNHNACLAAFHDGDLHLYASFAGGAITRLFLRDRIVLEDLGIELRVGDETYTTKVYDATRSIQRLDNGVLINLPVRRVRYFFPTLAQRLALRFGSTTGYTSRWTRALIDHYRIKKNTAINQAGTSVGVNSERWSLERRICIHEDGVLIVDTFRDSAAALSSDALHADLKVNAIGVNPFRKTFTGAAEVSVRKTIHYAGGAAVANIITRWA